MSTDCSRLIRIAIIDEPDHWRRELAHSMKEAAGFHTATFSDLDSCLTVLDRQMADVVLVGFGRDGQPIVRLRRHCGSVGLLVLLEPGQDAEHRARSLDMGADMALSASCPPEELFASVRALWRRLRDRVASPRGWRLQGSRRVLLSPSGSEAELSPHEFVFLQQLADAFPQPVARQQLVHALGFDYLDFDERRLEALASRIRRKLHRSDPEGTSPLRSARLQGYFFAEPIHVDKSRPA